MRWRTIRSKMGLQARCISHSALPNLMEAEFPREWRIPSRRVPKTPQGTFRRFSCYRVGLVEKSLQLPTVEPRYDVVDDPEGPALNSVEKRNSF